MCDLLQIKYKNQYFSSKYVFGINLQELHNKCKVGISIGCIDIDFLWCAIILMLCRGILSSLSKYECMEKPTTALYLISSRYLTLLWSNQHFCVLLAFYYFVVVFYCSFCGFKYVFRISLGELGSKFKVNISIG